MSNLGRQRKFTDEPVIGHAAREVIEQLAGVWICEAADLAGLSKKEVEIVEGVCEPHHGVARGRHTAGCWAKRKRAGTAFIVGADQRRYLSAIADRQSAVLAGAGAGACWTWRRSKRTGCS